MGKGGEGGEGGRQGEKGERMRLAEVLKERRRLAYLPMAHFKCFKSNANRKDFYKPKH